MKPRFPVVSSLGFSKVGDPAEEIARWSGWVVVGWSLC